MLFPELFDVAFYDCRSSFSDPGNAHEGVAAYWLIGALQQRRKDSGLPDCHKHCLAVDLRDTGSGVQRYSPSLQPSRR